MLLLVFQAELASLNESKGQPVDYDTLATPATREHTFVVPTEPSLDIRQPAAGAAGETTMQCCHRSEALYCCGAVLA